MKIVKGYPEADEIIVKLKQYDNEDGKNTYFEVLEEETKDAIVLGSENKYPPGYGLVVLSSKIDGKLLDRKDVVFLGLSNYSKAEIEILERNKIRYFTMKKITQLSLSECIDLAMESAMQFEKLCLSIDLDVLDSAFSKDGIVGGMTPRELIYCVQRMKMMKNLRTVEITGENKNITAKLIKELS